MDEQNLKAMIPLGSLSQSATALDRFMVRMGAAFPRHDQSLETTTLYYERLNRFSDDQLARACDILIDHCEYFPTIAEIILTIQRLPKRNPGLMIEHRPSKDEAARVVADLKAYIKTSEGIDSERATERVNKRREFLRIQAKLIEKLNGSEEKKA